MKSRRNTLGLTQRRSIVLAMTLIVASFAGCAENKVVTELNRNSANEFLLGPEDVLEIVVWRNQDLSRQVVVRPDGMISMPLIGDVPAAGLTTDQLAARIAKRLKDYKENPTVSVSLKEVNSYNIFVLGEVAKPGKYQLKSYTTILQAISLAGGFTPFASKNKLQIVRHITNGDGGWREIRLAMPYDDILSGRGDPEFFIVRSGDTIVVP
jgi:polysaccharide biosynthesis/export protein